MGYGIGLAVASAGECGEIIESGIHTCFGETVGLPTLECFKKKRAAGCVRRNAKKAGKKAGKCFTRHLTKLSKCLRMNKVNTIGNMQ